MLQGPAPDAWKGRAGVRGVESRSVPRADRKGGGVLGARARGHGSLRSKSVEMSREDRSRRDVARTGPAGDTCLRCNLVPSKDREGGNWYDRPRKWW